MILPLLLSACTFGPGAPFVELSGATLEARFEPGARALGGGAVTTDLGYRYVLTDFSVELHGIELEGSAEAPAAEDHGHDHGHDHEGEAEHEEAEHEEGEHEEGEHEEGEHGAVTGWERDDTLDLLGGATLDLGRPAEPDLPKGTLSHLALVVDSARLIGRFESLDGQSSLPFQFELPGTVLEAELDLAIERSSPETLQLAVAWEVDGTLFDGLDVQTLAGAPDPAAILVEAVSEHLWHHPLEVTVIEGD